MPIVPDIFGHFKKYVAMNIDKGVCDLASKRQKNTASRMRKEIVKDKREGLQERIYKSKTVMASTAFVVFLLLVSFLLVFLVFRDNRSFEVMLQELDQLQKINTPTLRQYQNIVNKAKNERDYLRILKRVYQIKDQELQNQYLIDVTQRALKKIPDSENILAHQVSALLENDMFNKAFLAAANLQSSRYLSIKGEILVRSLVRARQENGAPIPESESELEIEKMSISEVLDSSPYSAAMYINLARLLNQPRFAWNAALIYMFSGEKNKALNLIRELKSFFWLNTFAAGLIAYDNQDWELVASLLEREVEQAGNNLNVKTLQYLGDAYAFLGNYEKVIEVLSLASGLNSDPQENLLLPKEQDTELQRMMKSLGTWELYYNLASAYRITGKNARAFEVLRLGRSVFPSTSELLLLLNMVAPPDEKQYAKSVLTEFIAKNQNGQPYLLLASLIFEEDRSNQQKFGSRLWQLFSKYPDYEQILRYLLWYYIGLSRIEDVDLGLERYKNLVLAPQNQDYTNWMKEYMAINAALERDFDQSQKLFGDLIAQEPSWFRYYNMANVYVYRNNIPEAVRHLQKALEFSNRANKIEIYYRIAMLGEIENKEYLLPEQIQQLDRILQVYVDNNYRLDVKAHKPQNEILSMKLDSLLLWRKSQGSDLLDSLSEKRKSDKQQRIRAEEETKASENDFSLFNARFLEAIPQPINQGLIIQ